MSRSTFPKSAVSSQALLGIVFVLLSALGLASQNIVSRLFFVPSDVGGAVTLGGWLSPQLSNIVMLLALRMLLMAGLLAIAAPRLYPRTFVAIRQLTQDATRLAGAVGSGLCLFVCLIALYFSLSQIAAGIAIAVFFIYPAVTVLLAWRYLQQRPRPYQLGLMVIIFLGVVLTTLGPATGAAVSAANPTLGILGGVLAGLGFGLYGICAEIALQATPQSSRKSAPKPSLQPVGTSSLPSARKSSRQSLRESSLQAPLPSSAPSRQALHPVPFSLITFVIVAALAGVSLLLMPPVTVPAGQWPPVLAMTLFSALVTAIAYVLNNFGIRLIGASLTALISASSPALTALLAWFTLQESLQLQQVLGVACVTLGVAALSLKAKPQS